MFECASRRLIPFGSYLAHSCSCCSECDVEVSNIIVRVVMFTWGGVHSHRPILRMVSVMQIRALVFVSILIGSMSFAVVADERSSNTDTAYQVEMSVSRDGTIISKPRALVSSGTEANLISEDPVDSSRNYRLVIKVQPSAFVSDAKREAIDIKAIFYEQVAGEFVLRGEPSATVYVGDQAKLTLSNSVAARTAPTYELTITATRASTEKLGAIQACPGVGLPLLGVLNDSGQKVSCPVVRGFSDIFQAAFGISTAQASGAAIQGCCSASCGTQGLNCCNVVWCCENLCGACCSPP